MRSKGFKVLAASLASVLMLQSGAVAAPIDELKEIMENQFAEEEDLLSKQLGAEELEEAIEENGLKFSANIAPGKSMLDHPEMAETFSADDYAYTNVQWDPQLKKWLFEAGAGTEKGALLDLSLYGDTEQLDISIPQFYDGGLKIVSGNLRDLFVGSALEQLLQSLNEEGSFQPEDIPDLDLKFYPEEGDTEAFSGLFESFSEDSLEKKIEAISDKMEVEKEETEEGAIYHTSLATEDVLDLYRDMMDAYFSLFEKTGLLDMASDNSLTETEDQIAEAMETMGSMLGEEILIDVCVENDLVTKVSASLYVDTQTFAEEMESETEETTENRASDAVEVSDEFQGYINYEILFENPEKPYEHMNLNMRVVDLEETELAALSYVLETEITETTMKMTVNIDIKEGDTLIGDTQTAVITYDAQTGDLDARFDVNTEKGARAVMTLDSTFSEVESGKSFLWTIDDLSVSSEDNVVGLTAQIRVNAQAGEFAAPEKEIDLFGGTVNDLYGLLGEVSMKAQEWFSALSPETEETEAETSADFAA